MARKLNQQSVSPQNNNYMSAPISQGVQNPTFWGGAPAGFASSSRYSPEQMQQAGQLGQVGTQGLINLAKNQFDFGDIENQTRKDFQEKTLPSIMQRFASFGTGDRFSSSAFQNAMKSGATDLDSQLAGMRAKFGMQGQALNQNLYGQMAQFGQNPMWDQHWQERQGGFGENALQSLISGLGAGAGMYATGGMSAAIPALAGILGGFGGNKSVNAPQNQMGQGGFNMGTQPNWQQRAQNLTPGKQMFGF